jgi:hypothetical protein
VSSALSSISCASRFSRRWTTLVVPGMGSITGDRASSQASVIWIVERQPRGVLILVNGKRHEMPELVMKRVLPELNVELTGITGSAFHAVVYGQRRKTCKTRMGSKVCLWRWSSDS